MHPTTNKRTRYLLMFVALIGLFVTSTTDVLALIVQPVAAVPADVLAVVGRPLTPVSYAGVARRTVRRSTY